MATLSSDADSSCVFVGMVVNQQDMHMVNKVRAIIEQCT